MSQTLPPVAQPARPTRAAALVCAFLIQVLVAVTPSSAQNFDVRSIARMSGVVGVPDTRIDLTKPASKKYAIVVGNGDYDTVPGLKNAVNDARLVSDYLASIGYAVNEYYDLDKQEFEAVMRRMLFDVSEGDEVVFYFAGHGVQIGKGNYIFPTDAMLDSVYDVPFEAVSLTSLLSIVGARARSLVVILDSCRNNPFENREAIVGLDTPPAELQTGFSPQNTPINSLLVFSTSPGAVALDGVGDNSPFTSAFVAAARESAGQPLETVMKKVRRAVYDATGGLQVPWESSSLVEPIVIGGGGGDMVATRAVPQPMGQADVRITAPLGPEVRIGDLLRQQLNLPATAQIALANAPHNGRLDGVADGRYRGLSLLPVDGAGLDDIAYTHTGPEQSARINGSNPQIDQFNLAVNGQETTVELALEVNPCDFHAGDYLDPEGVGIARYPNELEPAAALAACQAAVAAAPDVGRFHYQLGRAHLALRQLDDAQAAIVRARDLGHTRAWYGLGLIESARAKETGGAGADEAPNAALAYWAMGVDRGDPYAFHALGRQLLLYSDDAAVRRQGFDLMSRALELGHTFSMNALGTYFLNQKADHYDPERGLRYLRESAARKDIYGYQNMGVVTLNGLGGVEKDPAAALEWFRMAAAEGHPSAPTFIGRMYVSGDATGQADPATAVGWFDQGLARGDAWGGTNAARAIARANPAGYTPGDAALRAAKAATLRNARAAAAAEEVLVALGTRAVDQGAQLLIAELGEEVAADGAFGPGSQAALDRVAARHNTTFPAEPIARIKALAKLTWQLSRFRADLY